ncbi:MAG: L-2-hydroxyglutarate oxidase [Cyclobacteriaceae bacterium]
MGKSVCIVGGGIVGLATGLKLLQSNPQISLKIIEKEAHLAYHQTGHNSGVIHSGLYYKPGSLKAKNCIDGYNELLRFCIEYNIKHELCGKIVVATSKEEIPYLETLQQRGVENGLSDLKRLSAEELKEYEPHVNGVAGIHVPQTGIIDYKQVASKYGEVIEAAGGEIHLNEKVIKVQDNQLITSKSDYSFDLLINCAGLYSDKVSRMGQSKVNVKIVPFRGEYYKIKTEREHLVKNLIYPVPDPNFPFLGVHFTRMIEGGVEAGPNAVLAFRREGYSKRQVHLGELFETLSWPGFQKVAMKYWRTGAGEMYRSFSKAAFTKALQKLIPEIKQDDLEDGGAGVRAQACDRTGGLLDDFNIIEEKNMIHVCNAPSPAATSSLAIGGTIAEMALEKL